MSESPELPVVILTTAPSAESAETMAGLLLKERLAACVSQVPGVKSLFHWEGKLDSADEVLLVVKTLVTHVPALTERLCEVHPYDVPEILALPVAAGHGPYLDWMRKELNSGGSDHDAT